MTASKSLLLSVWFLVISKTEEIIGGGFIVSGELDEGLGGNVATSDFVVGVGGLSAVKHLGNVGLLQVSVLT